MAESLNTSAPDENPYKSPLAGDELPFWRRRLSVRVRIALIIAAVIVGELLLLQFGGGRGDLPMWLYVYCLASGPIGAIVSITIILKRRRK